jgi:hypothetical protein
MTKATRGKIMDKAYIKNGMCPGYVNGDGDYHEIIYYISALPDKAYCKRCDVFYDIYRDRPERSKREDSNCFMDCQRAMCDGWDNCICGDHINCNIEMRCSEHCGNTVREAQ